MSKTKGKAYGMTALCLLVVCLLTVALSGTVYAASNPIDVAVPVEQTFNITGTDRTDLSGAFKYEMTANKTDDPLPSGAVGGKYSFTLDGTKKTSMEIQYTHAGEYLYTVKQTLTAEKPGYTYDKEVYTVKVYIRNTANDLLESEVIVQRADKNKTASVAFVNAYQPKATDPKLMVDPPVKKTVTGSPATAEQFEFTLNAGKPEYPMPEGSVSGVKAVTITGAGSAEFGVWEYKAAGTYTYTVKEINKGVSGYSYDKTMYTIKDVVTDKDGELKLTRTVTSSAGAFGGSCSFTNAYKKQVGPKTGDDADNTVLIVIVCAGVAVAVAAALYLIYIKRRNKNASER